MRPWTIALLLTAAVGGVATAQSDFRWHGRLTPGQTVEIQGLNGAISATAAASGEVEVTATKTAHHSDPAEVRIEAVPSDAGITICAVYPGQAPCAPGGSHEGRRRHESNDTTVRFDVRVPPGVKFSGRTVNGSVEATSLAADTEGRTVNGSVRLSTTGLASAETVNGTITVSAGRADWPEGARFSTVNGAIALTLPATLSARLRASVVNGSITSDFPITVSGEISRRRLEGTIGQGGQELTLRTVNGSIRLTKAP